MTFISTVNETLSSIEITEVFKCPSTIFPHSSLVRDVEKPQDSDIDSTKSFFQTLSTFHHSHFPSFVESFEMPKAVCCSDDDFEGTALRQTADRFNSFPEDQTHAICLQLLDIIEYLHEHSLSHRNLNPDNVLLDEIFRINVVGWSSLADSSGSRSLFPHSILTGLSKTTMVRIKDENLKPRRLMTRHSRAVGPF
jgi:serine/threonine protein kinase